MHWVSASDFLASAEKSTIPGWIGWVIVISVGFVGGWLALRIPMVRSAGVWLRLVVCGLAGGVVGAIVWCLAYYVFNVDLP